VNDSVGLKRGTVALAKDHAAWVKIFEDEKRLLWALVGNIALDIQHVGSTSIPDLSAKPIIDMLMAVRSLSDVAKIKETLENTGYHYRENGSDAIQILFAKGPEEKRTHYLHITELNSSEWRNSLAFRDYLRMHPDEVKRYEELKQKLAEQYPNDRGSYSAGKKAYFEEVFKKAKGV